MNNVSNNIKSIDPTKCDPTILKNGVSVFITNGDATSKEMEAWVQMVAQESKQPVDWFILGGRDVVKTTGNVKIVKCCISKLFPQLYQTVLERIRNEREATGFPFNLECILSANEVTNREMQPNSL